MVKAQALSQAASRESLRVVVMRAVACAVGKKGTPPQSETKLHANTGCASAPSPQWR